MSRGRVENTLYVVDDKPRDHDAHSDEYEQPMLERVRTSIRRTAAQTMATEHTPTPEPEPDTGADFEIDL